jgi:hypothetical protein
VAITYDDDYSGGSAGDAVTTSTAEVGALTGYTSLGGAINLTGDGAIVGAGGGNNGALFHVAENADSSDTITIDDLVLPSGGSAGAFWDIGMRENATGDNVVALSVLADRTVRFRTYVGTTYTTLATSATTFTAGTAYKFTITVNGNDFALYVDDNPTPDLTATSSVSAGNTFQSLFAQGQSGTDVIRIGRARRSDTVDAPTAAFTKSDTQDPRRILRRMTRSRFLRAA